MLLVLHSVVNDILVNQLLGKSHLNRISILIEHIQPVIRLKEPREGDSVN
jgi:hypothetical protein